MQQLLLHADGVFRMTEVEAPAELPEFHFTPRTHYGRRFLCISCDEPIREQPGQANHWMLDDAGPYCRRCVNLVLPFETHEPRVLNQPTKVRAANPPGKADPDWDVAVRGKARFSKIPLQKSTRAPLGTAPAFVNSPFLPDSYKSKAEDLDFIRRTQDLELATAAQELAAIGIPSMSIERPAADEEREANISEMRRSGTPYETVEPDLARRIEWERYVSKCGAVVLIHTKRTATGRTLAVEDRRWTKDDIVAYIPHYREAFPNLADQDELEANKAHIAHMRLRVIDLMSPEDRDAWYHGDYPKRAYLAPADDNVAREREPIAEIGDRGPVEIGTHGDGGNLVVTRGLWGRLNDDDITQTEPTEFDLWPLTPYEKKHGVTPFDAVLARSRREYAAIWER